MNYDDRHKHSSRTVMSSRTLNKAYLRDPRHLKEREWRTYVAMQKLIARADSILKNFARAIINRDVSIKCVRISIS